MAKPDIRIGPRLDSIEYDGEITGIDYLTGIEFPLSHLVLVTADRPEFSIEEASYIARFSYKYGCGNSKNAPVFVEESSLEVIEKAMNEDVPVKIREHND